MNFGEKLAILLRRAGLSQNALARELNILPKNISNWVEGMKPRPDALARIAEYFHVAIEDLTDDRRDLPPPSPGIAEAAAAASALFPDDPVAGQQLFEILANAPSLARNLRRMGAKLCEFADQIEAEMAATASSASRIKIPDAFKVAQSVKGQIAAGKPELMVAEDEGDYYGSRPAKFSPPYRRSKKSKT